MHAWCMIPSFSISHLPSFLPGMETLRASSPSLHLSLALFLLLFLAASFLPLVVRKNHSHAGKSCLLLAYVQSLHSTSISFNLVIVQYGR